MKITITTTTASKDQLLFKEMPIQNCTYAGLQILQTSA